MNPPPTGDTTHEQEAKLPPRDWIVLPLLGLLTVALLLGGAELGARRMLTARPTAGENCLVLNDPVRGARGIPDCVVQEKVYEGKLTEYRFNSSGYRNDFNFAPKSPDVYRIVMVGTSVAAGFRVQDDKTFAVLLPAQLSQRTGRTIELYNEGLPWRSPSFVARDFDEILAVKPDMILWILTPTDIRGEFQGEHQDKTKSMSSRAKTWYRIKTAFATKSFTASIATIFSHTRMATLLRDWLYASPSEYAKSSLIGGDYNQQFLLSESTPDWRKKLEEFDSSAADVAHQAKKAGIPLVAVFVPDRTQAAMVSLMGAWPNGFDPYKIDRELQSIIVSHGATYIDILPDYRAIPNPQLGYFAIDGHPNESGHATIAKLLSQKLAGCISIGVPLPQGRVSEAPTP